MPSSSLSALILASPFFASKRAKAAKLKKLAKKALLPGVKGLTAKNEIAQINAQGVTEMNRLEMVFYDVGRGFNHSCPQW